MKSYSKSDVSNDPSRFSWTNNHSNLEEPRVNYNSNVLERDIFLKDSIANNKQVYNQIYPTPIRFIKPQVNRMFPKQEMHYEPPPPSKPLISQEQFTEATHFLHKKPVDSITSSSNERQRYQTMVNEVMIKDKEIQRLKVINEQLNDQMRDLEKDKMKFQTNENEINILQDKLSKQMEISNEMTDVKLKYNQLLKAYEEQEETIKSLKLIIQKYNTIVSQDNKPEKKDTKPEKKYTKDTKDTNYKNKQIEETLPKFYEGIPKEAIEHILQEFKITEETDITEDLLRKIDAYINEAFIEK